MPHFTLEYSANLDPRLDIGKVVEVVRKAAVETGIFPLGGIRVRSVRCEYYAIADGQPDFGFLDMVLRLGEGGGGAGPGGGAASRYQRRPKPYPPVGMPAKRTRIAATRARMPEPVSAMSTT